MPQAIPKLRRSQVARSNYLCNNETQDIPATIHTVFKGLGLEEITGSMYRMVLSALVPSCRLSAGGAIAESGKQQKGVFNGDSGGGAFVILPYTGPSPLYAGPPRARGSIVEVILFLVLVWRTHS